MLIEPIQGESGVYPLSDEALLAARAGLRRGRGAADPRRDPDRDGADRLALGLRADPVRPDVLTSAKALGGGLPVGACVTDARGRRGARGRRPRLDLRRRRGRLGGGARRARPGRRPGAAARACASWAPRCARACWRSTGSSEVRGRGLMLGVGLEAGHRRRRARRRPARARPDRQRPRARHAAPAAAADGRFGPDRARRCADRRIAPKLRVAMSAREAAHQSGRRPPRPPTPRQRLADDRRGRRAAAARVIDDAERAGPAPARRGARPRRPDRRRAAARAGRRARPARRRRGAPRAATWSRSRPPERRGRADEPPAPRRSGSAGARLLATQMAVSGAEPRGDRSAAAQRLRDRGHQRDPRRDPRARRSRPMHDDPTRVMGQPGEPGGGRAATCACWSPG